MLINVIVFACLITDFSGREDYQPLLLFDLMLVCSSHYTTEKNDYSEQKFGENYFHSKIASTFHNYLKIISK